MRLGTVLLAMGVLASSACSDDRSARLAAEWGCGPIEGLAAIRGEAAPDWLLVGEFTETAEAPAAIAEIACHLATDGQPLFVGVAEYPGGETDSETKLFSRLDALIAKGALLAVARIGGDDHAYDSRDRSRSEKAWAQTLTAKVVASGASRALLLVASAYAIAEPIPATGDRFAGYSPMPTFLGGGVVSLAVATRPGLATPSIRLHPEPRDGFHGQLAFSRLTRPEVPLILSAAPPAVAEAVIDEVERLRQLDADILREAQTQARQLLDDDAALTMPAPEAPPPHQPLDLPDFDAN